MPTLIWTDNRSPANAGLLDLHYTNRATVMHYSENIGSVYALTNGYYRPSIDGIRGEDCATPDQAAREVARLHELYGRR
jgi:hypothetical protein